MTPAEALRLLRMVRYQPLRGRQLTMAELARMAGYNPDSLRNASHRGWLAQDMVDRLAPILGQTTILPDGHIALKRARGRDPRGGARTRRQAPAASARPAGARGPSRGQASTSSKKDEEPQELSE